MIQDCEIPYCGNHRGESHGESSRGYAAQRDFSKAPLGVVTEDRQQIKTNSAL